MNYTVIADPSEPISRNVANSNTPVNITWLSGARFERATTVIPPRIAKFGVKFDW